MKNYFHNAWGRGNDVFRKCAPLKVGACIVACYAFSCIGRKFQVFEPVLFFYLKKSGLA